VARGNVDTHATVGYSDSPARRLEDFNATLRSAGEPSVSSLVAFKVRPLSAKGRPLYMSDQEYDAVRPDLVPEHAPHHPALDPRFWLVDRDGDVRVLYAQHETGWELLIAAVGAGMTAIQAAPIAVPWLANYIRRMRGEIEREDKRNKRSARDRRVSLSIESYVDERGARITNVDVQGDFDDSALPHLIESGMQSMTERARRAEAHSRHSPS
jgi:hypothetical protein